MHTFFFDIQSLELDVFNQIHDNYLISTVLKMLTWYGDKYILQTYHCIFYHIKIAIQRNNMYILNMV